MWETMIDGHMEGIFEEIRRYKVVRTISHLAKILIICGNTASFLSSMTVA
jgi:hypothetical protein